MSHVFIPTILPKMDCVSLCCCLCVVFVTVSHNGIGAAGVEGLHEVYKSDMLLHYRRLSDTSKRPSVGWHPSRENLVSLGHTTGTKSYVFFECQ
jgi:hypothetical protein